jgi:hypothetical protein
MSIHTSGPFWCGDGPNWQGIESDVCARDIWEGRGDDATEQARYETAALDLG